MGVFAVIAFYLSEEAATRFCTNPSPGFFIRNRVNFYSILCESVRERVYYLNELIELNLGKR
jgi:hypothetical protein